jgi:hypothetical protein
VGVIEMPKKHSSEKERKKSPKRQEKKKTKTASIVIDREEVLKVDQAVLPADAIFKGYEENVAQNNHCKDRDPHLPHRRKNRHHDSNILNSQPLKNLVISP